MTETMEHAADTAAIEPSAIHHELVRIVRALRARSGPDALAAGSMSALWTIAQRAPIRATELADRERVATPTMSRIVAALERDGLVTRDSDPTDGRVSLLRPTAVGTAYVSGATSRKAQVIGQALDLLADTDRAAVKRSLGLLADALTDLPDFADTPADLASDLPAEAAPRTTVSDPQ